MGRKKKEVAKKEEDGDDVEVWEDPVIEAEEEPVQLRLRDWRDVERLRELKELRQIVDENDPALEEIFKVQPKPEPVKAAAKAAKNAAAKNAATKPGKAAAPAAEKPAAKKTPKPAAKKPPKKAPKKAAKKAATPRPKAKSKAPKRR